jgi:hypothetical protein
MNAVLAIIADGGRAIIVINREAVEIIIFSFSLLILLNPFHHPPPDPFGRGSARTIGSIHRSHAVGGANGSIMVGMFVCLCLTSKKPSEREFFVPAGTDLGVKLLT